MTSVRRRGLKLDDPLGLTEPTQPAGPPTPADPPTAPEPVADRGVEATNRHSREKVRREEPDHDWQDETTRASRPAGPGVWRAWSGITGVGSFRLPHELLVELSDTARELALPIGLIVTAAITQLLDQPSEQIAALVDKADDARIQGRRRARRRLTGRTDG